MRHLSMVGTDFEDFAIMDRDPFTLVLLEQFGQQVLVGFDFGSERSELLLGPQFEIAFAGQFLIAFNATTARPQSVRLSR